MQGPTVDLCGVMHVKRKGVKRSEEMFYVGGDEVEVVEEYKYIYLGCVVNEQLQCKNGKGEG